MRRVVLVEDEESLLDTLSMFLEEFDCEVHGYSSLGELSDSGLVFDCGTEDSPCLFLVDQNLPGERGLDFIEKRLAEGHCRCGGKCMAIMSGGLDAAELQKARSLGCYIFEKPVMFADLEEWFDSLEA